MKKTIERLIIMLLILVLTGCGAAGNAGATASKPNSSGKVDGGTAIAKKAEAEEKLTTEFVDSDIVAYKDYGGNVRVSCYYAIKNTSGKNIYLTNEKIEFSDDDDQLLAVVEYADCIPDVLKPGQVGYLFVDSYNMKDVDLSNGLWYKPSAKVKAASSYYEIELSDLSFRDNYGWIEVSCRGLNKAQEEKRLVKIGFLAFNEEGKLIGTGYTFENFDAGENSAFTISGDLLSDDYVFEDIDRIQVYAQGCSNY